MTKKAIGNLQTAFTFFKVDKQPLRYILFVTLCSLISFNTFSLPSKFRLVGIGDLSTEMTLVFDASNNPNVCYGLNPSLVNNLTSTCVSPNSINDTYRMQNNIFRLTNLQPNAKYYFKAVDDEGSSELYHFYTLPNDNTPLSIIAGGCSRNNRTIRQLANKMVAKLKPHAVMFTGDFTNNSNSEEWQDWFDDWQYTIDTNGRHTPIIPTRGNHENNNRDLSDLFDTNATTYYTSFNNSLLSIITLNTESTFLNYAIQTDWLQNTLAQTNTTYKIVQYHKPIRPHFGGYLENASAYYYWANMFEDYQVDLVVESNSHTSKTTWPVSVCTGGLCCKDGFRRNDANGVVYTGEGGWGVPIRPADNNRIWTRHSGSINQFKWIFVYPEKMELRTVKYENVADVSELDINNRFQLPQDIDINGEVTTIKPPNDLPEITNFPQNNSTFVGIQPITLIADIENSNKTINQVSIYINGDLVGNFNTSPYQFEDWTVGDYGVYTLTTITKFSSGETKVTDSHFQVIEPLQTDYAQLNSSFDDAEQLSSNRVDAVNRDMDLGYNGTIAGLRFQNVNIPPNATVTSAYIQFTADERKSEPTTLTIYGEKKANPETFVAYNYNISGRTKTNSSVMWNPADWENMGDNGPAQQTPNLSNIMNEIINQDGFSLENPIAFIIEGNGYRVSETYDSDSTEAPVLHYSYFMEDSFEELIDVWPGDADNNGKVTVKDILYISVSDGNTGPIRLNATTDWIPQPATPWNSIVDGVNLAHQDADGDGIINRNDNNVVKLNYDKQTSWYMPEVDDPTNILKLKQTSPVGKTTQYDLVLETENPATVHGIHGSIDLSGFLKSSQDSVKIDTTFKSILEADITFTKFHQDTKILDFAVSRTDRQDKIIKDASLLRLVIIVDEIVDGRAVKKASINSSGIITSTGNYENLRGSTFFAYQYELRTINQQNETSFNFNLITTNSYCKKSGRVEVQIFSDDLNNYNFEWSNGMSGYQVYNLEEGEYTLAITKDNNHLRTIDFEIESMPGIPEMVTIDYSTIKDSLIRASKEILIKNDVEIPKDYTVKFLIENCE